MHDIHDEDLAKGIADCLNLDGYNEMRATLKMGGFTITNLGQGSGPDDVARRGEVAGALNFDDTTRTLTLQDKEGNDITSVVVPGGGGGTPGTVSISQGAGIVCTPNPISGTGTVALAGVPDVAGSYTNGIGSMTVDAYGRVTAVGESAFRVDLDLTRNATTATISNTAGNGVTIPQASATNAGLLTAADKAKLNSFDPQQLAVYEEGSFKPTVSYMTVDSDSVINWYRVGRTIHFFGHLDWGARTDNSQPLVIRGLPYDSVNTAASNPFITGNYVANQYINGFGDLTDDFAFTQGLYVPERTDEIRIAAFFGRNSPNPGDRAEVLMENLASFGFFDFAGWYIADVTNPNPSYVGTRTSTMT